MRSIIGTLVFVLFSAAAYADDFQTLSHCGMVPAPERDYTRTELNVRLIQHKLELIGYSVGKHGIDGRLGKDTKQAIARFQDDFGLHERKRVGAETAMTLAWASHPILNVTRCNTPYVVVTR